MNSPTNTSMKIMNTGPMSVAFVSYLVKDTYGQVYASANWSELSLSPNAVVTVNILIDGKDFTFQSSSSYTIVLVTSRNNQFYFTVTG